MCSPGPRISSEWMIAVYINGETELIKCVYIVYFVMNIDISREQFLCSSQQYMHYFIHCCIMAVNNVVFLCNQTNGGYEISDFNIRGLYIIRELLQFQI